MRAVWLEVPEEFLEERRRLGHDKRDELWDGVLHMVPPAEFAHQDISTRLAVAFFAIGKPRGLAPIMDAGLFEANRDKSYRVPDVMLGRPDHIRKRGLEGAELVVEVLSPNDESRDKFDFYARLGVPEVWILDPETRELEVYALRDAAYVFVLPVDAMFISPVLGITMEVVEGPVLRLCDGDEVHDI